MSVLIIYCYQRSLHTITFFAHLATGILTEHNSFRLLYCMQCNGLLISRVTLSFVGYYQEFNLFSRWQLNNPFIVGVSEKATNDDSAWEIADDFVNNLKTT
jgi:hypothetical protein